MANANSTASDYIIHPGCKLVLKEQLARLSDVMGIVSTAAVAHLFDCGSIDNPGIYQALKFASRAIDDIYGRLNDLELAASSQTVLAALKQKEEDEQEESTEVSHG